MTTFSIHIVKSDFASSNSVEAGTPEDARSTALKGALRIGTDEVCRGHTFFGAEISIKDGDDVVKRLIGRHRDIEASVAWNRSCGTNTSGLGLLSAPPRTQTAVQAFRQHGGRV